MISFTQELKILFMVQEKGIYWFMINSVQNEQLDQV